MTSNADQPISALRTGNDQLVATVHGLAREALSGPSGASEWTIAQVLSHLGSGAEIGLASLKASVGVAEKPADGFNRTVWDRWDAMSPDEQAHGFMMANEKLVRQYEGLDEQTRNNTRIDLGFLPAPVDVATSASLRLHEFGLHTWDVAVAIDPSATLAPEAVEAMLTVIPYLIGWIGRPGDVLGGRAVTVAVHTTSPERDFGLEITDKVTITGVPDDPDASLTLPAESWLRLATGRLSAAHTPAEVSAVGTVSLADLRQIFPGY